MLKRYVTAGEAVIAYARTPAERQRILEEEAPEETNPDREADYARRAAGRARRWIRANRCCYLWTFTFAKAVVDYGQLALAVDRFLRRLAESESRTTAGPARTPRFLLIGEPHPGGHGWHVHGATDVYIQHEKMKKMWAEGHVWVSPPKRGRGAWVPRRLSGYLSKYLTKQLTPDELHGCSPRPAGAHRYWVTQGHDPEVIRTWYPTFQAAYDDLVATYGLPDVAVEFGRDDGPIVAGTWFSFPDTVVERWVQRVNAEVRAQRGVR